tara:strand:+ start:8667 stop:9467 length:801 start_codon:yes stop_codon:yes gene_type:complete
MSISQISGSASTLAPEHRLDTVYTRDIAGIIDVADSDELQSTFQPVPEQEIEEVIGIDATSPGAAQYVTYNFLKGWNMIGSVLPYAQDIQATFAEIEDNIEITKNNAAQVYWPEFGFNGIGDFLPGQGYQIKMREAIEFTIPLFGANLAINEQVVENRQLLWHTSLYEHGYINILEGWNIIGFNRRTPQNAIDAFANGTVNGIEQDITHKIQIVKNNTADVYWPEYTFNGIGNLFPGQGYQIKVTETIYNFRFPPDDFIDSSAFSI